MRKVYVAGPYRGSTTWDVEQNVRRVEEVGYAVARLGAVPVVPHTMYRYSHGQLTDRFWLDATLELLRCCDAVLLCDGWPRSVGSRGELAEALRLDLSVFVHWDADLASQLPGTPHDEASLLAWVRASASNLDAVTDVMRSALERRKVDATSAAEEVFARMQTYVRRLAMRVVGAEEGRLDTFEEAAYSSLHGRSRPSGFAAADWEAVRAATLAAVRETRTLSDSGDSPR